MIFSQIEMSSAATENKHKSYRFEHYSNKCVIAVLMFWPSCHALSAAAAYVENVMKWNALEFSFMNETLAVYDTQRAS